MDSGQAERGRGHRTWTLSSGPATGKPSCPASSPTAPGLVGGQQCPQCGPTSSSGPTRESNMCPPGTGMPLHSSAAPSSLCGCTHRQPSLSSSSSLRPSFVPGWGRAAAQLCDLVATTLPGASCPHSGSLGYPRAPCACMSLSRVRYGDAGLSHLPGREQPGGASWAPPTARSKAGNTEHLRTGWDVVPARTEPGWGTRVRDTVRKFPGISVGLSAPLAPASEPDSHRPLGS